MKLNILVDGKKIPANNFVRNVVRDVNIALIKSLRGVEKPEKIVVEIDLTEDEA